jgi:NAD(P) transhydrogenase subunit beta
MLIGVPGETLAGEKRVAVTPETAKKLIGLAAVFIAVAAVVKPWAFGIVSKGAGGVAPPIPFGNKLDLFLGAAIGAITFSGSVIAFGNLSGKYKFRLFQGTPVVFSGQHLPNAALGTPPSRWASRSRSPRTGPRSSRCWR